MGVCLGVGRDGTEIACLLAEAIVTTYPVSIEEGVDVRTLTPGSRIDVETQSRHYQIECQGGGSVRLSGHPQFCPEPTRALFHGSIDDRGTVEAGVIEAGSRLLFLLEDHGPLTTSRVLHVHVQEPELAA